MSEHVYATPGDYSITLRSDLGVRPGLHIPELVGPQAKTQVPRQSILMCQMLAIRCNSDHYLLEKLNQSYQRHPAAARPSCHSS